MMLSARYGRMKIGRCVKREPGFEPMLQDLRYLGCSADVLHILSTSCSGRSECSLRVNDQTFNDIKPCYDNLKMYLSVTHICVSGMIDCLLRLIVNQNYTGSLSVGQALRCSLSVCYVAYYIVWSNMLHVQLHSATIGYRRTLR